jgi:hypothetical protein
MKKFSIGEFYCGPGGLGLGAKLAKIKDGNNKDIFLLQTMIKTPVILSKKYPSKSNLYLRKKGINLLIKSFYPYLSNESKEIMDSIYESD